MFTAATSGVDSTPYVNQIMGGGAGDEDGGAGEEDDGAAQA